MRRGVN